jgi:flagellar basal body-associated protein FliL
LLRLAKLRFSGNIMPMEEEQKEEIFQSPPEYQSRLSRSGNGSSAKRYIIIIISLIVVVLIILGIFRFFGGESSETEELSPTPTFEMLPTDTPAPSPDESETTPEPTERTGTPTPTKAASSNPVDSASGLDRSDLSIHVLNGSGVTGAAKKAADFLEGLGYNVVDYDNADNSDYAQTEIQISSAQSKYLNLLKKDLSGEYTVGSSSDAPPSSETADAVVIVGQE